jgi:hypothetical protein
MLIGPGRAALATSHPSSLPRQPAPDVMCHSGLAWMRASAVPGRENRSDSDADVLHLDPPVRAVLGA